ncbi:signal peptidase subunit-domain-containing protein [Entophlyctis helioformis]|nr:signal peptidase subunit-domain-containing protein [Entophlyctis helioformis]
MHSSARACKCPCAAVSVCCAPPRPGCSAAGSVACAPSRRCSRCTLAHCTLHSRRFVRSRRSNQRPAEQVPALAVPETCDMPPCCHLVAALLPPCPRFQQPLNHREMHDLQSRVSALFSFFMTVLATQMALVALSHQALLSWSASTDLTAFAPTRVSLAAGKLSGHDYYNSYKEPLTNFGVLSFNLDADLSSYFNWNTKLLFVSAIVEFANPQFPLNQAVIWDDIIQEKEDAVISLKDKSYEYQVYDITNSLAGSTANLTLQLQVVPHVGFMRTFRTIVPNAVHFPKQPVRNSNARKRG